MAAETENETAPSRATDPELLALGRVLRILDELTEDGKRRAVAYLHDRFSQSCPTSGGNP